MERPLPEMGKIDVENGCYLLRVFWATTFPKIVKNSIFLLNFHQKISNLNIPIIICIVRPKVRKINGGFLSFLKNKLE